MKVRAIMDVVPTLAFLARPYVWVETTEKDTAIINGLEKAGRKFIDSVMPILAKQLGFTLPITKEELKPFMNIEITEAEKNFNILLKEVEYLGISTEDLKP